LRKSSGSPLRDAVKQRRRKGGWTTSGRITLMEERPLEINCLILVGYKKFVAVNTT